MSRPSSTLQWNRSHGKNLASSLHLFRYANCDASHYSSHTRDRGRKPGEQQESSAWDTRDERRNNCTCAAHRSLKASRTHSLLVIDLATLVNLSTGFLHWQSPDTEKTPTVCCTPSQASVQDCPREPATTRTSSLRGCWKASGVHGEKKRLISTRVLVFLFTTVTYW
jgi:hypothetical protein